MGCEFLVSEVPLTQEREKTYTEIFEESFPFYLAIGMPYAEYWAGDCTLARYYRKAYKIKQEEINNNAWLQGLYIYDAISTALHNALRGKNTKARAYAKQPYDFENKEKTEQGKTKEVDIEQQKALAWMESLVRINNKKKSQSPEPEPKTKGF